MSGHKNLTGKGHQQKRGKKLRKEGPMRELSSVTADRDGGTRETHLRIESSRKERKRRARIYEKGLDWGIHFFLYQRGGKKDNLPGGNFGRGRPGRRRDPQMGTVSQKSYR